MKYISDFVKRQKAIDAIPKEKLVWDSCAYIYHPNGKATRVKGQTYIKKIHDLLK